MALNAEQIRANFQEIKERVDGNGGLLSVSMKELRDAIGAGRLDAGPISQIGVNLDRCRLSSTELRSGQYHYALIYDPNQSVGKLIHAATGDDQDSDEQVRQALDEIIAGGSSAVSPNKQLQDEMEELRDTLRQVHALVSAYVE